MCCSHTRRKTAARRTLDACLTVSPSLESASSQSWSPPTLSSISGPLSAGESATPAESSPMLLSLEIPHAEALDKVDLGEVKKATNIRLLRKDTQRWERARRGERAVRP